MDPGRWNCSASARMAGCSSRIGETLRMLLGVTLLQREVLEAKAGGASTVTGGGASYCTTLTAHSEPYNGTVLHASQLKTKRECAWSCDCKNTMWPRVTYKRRHRGGDWIATGKANGFEFCSGALSFVPQRKTRSLWLLRDACRATVCRCRARVRCRTRTVRC